MKGIKVMGVFLVMALPADMLKLQTLNVNGYYIFNHAVFPILPPSPIVMYSGGRQAV